MTGAPLLEDEAVTDLARRVVTNEIFLSNDPRAIEFSFGAVLMFIEDKSMLENVGAIWEEWSKAGERSINGYPFFTSLHLVHEDNLPRLIAEIARMREALGIKPEEDGIDLADRDEFVCGSCEDTFDIEQSHRTRNHGLVCDDCADELASKEDES